jgi:hypothetical protein
MIPTCIDTHLPTSADTADGDGDRVVMPFFKPIQLSVAVISIQIWLTAAIPDTGWLTDTAHCQLQYSLNAMQSEAIVCG